MGSGNLYYLFGFKRIQSVRQLLLIILAHLVGWLFFFSLPTIFFRIEIVDSAFLYKEIVNKAFLIGYFYLNYFFFIPKLLLKKRPVIYCVALALSFALLFAQQLYVERKFVERLRNGAIGVITHFSIPGRTPEQFQRNMRFRFDSLSRKSGGFPPLRPSGGFSRRIAFHFGLENVLYPFLLLTLVAGFIHMIFILIRSKDEKKSLEMANLKAEVDLLKSQINPHFLFNTLNSIYSQVYNQSKNAAGSVLMLSEIFRYVIYDTTNEVASLTKDLHYVSNYISLQRLRLSQKVILDYTIAGDCNGMVIAPLLLITFIENAFKHGISYSSPSRIIIRIAIFNKTITMYISNPVVARGIFETDGIGLKNARRRLDLLYAGNYQLDISNDQAVFVVNLKINLDRD